MDITYIYNFLEESNSLDYKTIFEIIGTVASIFLSWKAINVSLDTQKAQIKIEDKNQKISIFKERLDIYSKLVDIIVTCESFKTYFKIKPTLTNPNISYSSGCRDVWRTNFYDKLHRNDSYKKSWNIESMLECCYILNEQSNVFKECKLIYQFDDKNLTEFEKKYFNVVSNLITEVQVDDSQLCELSELAKNIREHECVEMEQQLKLN